jgi:hypothetical protein
MAEDTRGARLDDINIYRKMAGISLTKTITQFHDFFSMVNSRVVHDKYTQWARVWRAERQLENSFE